MTSLPGLNYFLKGNYKVTMWSQRDLKLRRELADSLSLVVRRRLAPDTLPQSSTVICHTWTQKLRRKRTIVNMQLLSSLQLTLLFILHAPRSSTQTLSGTQVDFRPIGRDGAFFVYSAHVDLSSQRSSIAVVAIVNRTRYGSGARVRCRFTMPAKNLLLSRVGQSDWATMVNGTLSILPDHHNLA